MLELADTRCSGRETCEITIPDALFARTKPCPEDLKPYLEADYVCAPGPYPLQHLLFSFRCNQYVKDSSVT